MMKLRVNNSLLGILNNLEITIEQLLNLDM
ncbi:hypothetical protein STAR110904_01745 [Staphylococcus argensis]